MVPSFFQTRLQHRLIAVVSSVIYVMGFTHISILHSNPSYKLTFKTCVIYSITDSIMPVITRELLRKRAEHNEGIIQTLEEVSLHQEELESINEVLGASCRKIKILYLQNNIISKMENLTHLKDLEYLNMALNNVKKIEGLQYVDD
jgi:Leucine-rich repeat (LRR) protein